MKIEKIYLISGIFIGLVLGVVAGVVGGALMVGFSFGTLAEYGNKIAIAIGTLVFILTLITAHRIGKNTRLKENFVEQKEIKKAKILLTVSVVILILSVAGAFYLNEKSKSDFELGKSKTAECTAFINARTLCYNKCQIDNQNCIIACNESHTQNSLYKKCNF